MIAIIYSIAPIFILIGVGVITQKLVAPQPRLSKMVCRLGFGSCETITSVLNRFALYLALPALIIDSLSRTTKSQIIKPEIIYFNLAFLVLAIIVVFATAKLFHAKKELANTYLFGAFFGSVAYVGFPLAERLYPGTDGIVSVLVAIHILVAFSLGIFILEKSKGVIKKMDFGLSLLKNPLLLSALIGLTLLSLEINLPIPLADAIAMLGKSASPVVLIALGTFMASEWRLDKTIWHAVVISALKTIGLPALFLTGLLFLPKSNALDLSVLIAGVPLALTNFALAEIYPMDKKIIANAIVLSIIFSLFTLTTFALILT